MFKKLNKKGFTLAELLVVVAIIGVLVAISIPIFTSQLEKSRDAVSVANMRAAYAEAQTLELTASKTGDKADKATYTAGTDGTSSVTVTGVAIKSRKGNDWSGLAADLPFKKADGTTLIPADKDNASDMNASTLKFDYDADGNLTAVTLTIAE